MAFFQVLIKSNGESPQPKEAIANETITPGHLIEFVGGNGASAAKLQKHATAGQDSNKLVAAEQDYIGSSPSVASGALAKTYASGDQVKYYTARRGDEMYMLLQSGYSISINQRLISNGDGTLKAHSPSSNFSTNGYLAIVGFAMEAIDTRGAANSRIRVEIA